MLKWEDYGVEIIGTARNGQQAADMIEAQRPDIVITDIKMPLKTGLELAEECARRYGKVPLFIILTSFEEIGFVRRAIGVQAVDYLVKLELTPESLAESVSKALSTLELVRKVEGPALSGPRGAILGLREKFFLRLYNNLFESKEQYLAQKDELGLDFSYPGFAAVIGEVEASGGPVPHDDTRLSLYTSSVRMIRETLEKTHPCYITVLDTRHFTITFCFEQADPPARRNALEEALRHTINLAHDYFSVFIRMAAGMPVNDPLLLEESYLSARRAFRETSREDPLRFFEPRAEDKGGGFAFSRVRPGIRRAFEELDAGALHEALTEIAGYFEDRPDLRIEAMDAACNILYMAISLFPDGEQTVEQIFAEDPEGYRGIYRMNSTDSVIAWLLKFRDRCGELLLSQRHNYKEQVVADVRDYIRHNLGKRLSLHEVAAVFNYSPNYLSQLFTKYGGGGFVEFITAERINAAREMLARGEGPVYEIAARLGFESAFYFSKVFKKVTGSSPRDFVHRLEEN
jgi:two-component system response regulator YesN